MYAYPDISLQFTPDKSENERNPHAWLRSAILLPFQELLVRELLSFMGLRDTLAGVLAELLAFTIR